MELVIDMLGPESLLLDLHAPAFPIDLDAVQRVGFDTMRPARHHAALVDFRDSPAHESFRSSRPGS